MTLKPTISWPQEAVVAITAFAAGHGERSMYFAQLDPADSPPDLDVNADLLMPAASLVKPLIVDAIISHVGLQELSRVTVEVGQLRSTMYPSILAAFDSSRRLSLTELCAFSIMTSDNSGADYLLDCYGADIVAARAEEIGLRATHVTVGYSDEHLGRSGRDNTSTARDIATLFRHLYESRQERAELWRWLINSLRNNRIPGELPDDLQVANKTGSLAGVANDAGVILGQPPLLVVVMTEGQADTNETTLEISKLTLEVCTALGMIR